MLLFNEAPPPKLSSLISIVIEEKVPEVPAPVEYTLEEKIKLDVNDCEPERWISAEDASCLPKRVVTARTTRNTAIQPQNQSSEGNGYSYGYCTYFAKQMRPDMPNNLGNANTWYKRYTGAKGSTPAVGAIGVAKSYTHVVYITAVDGDTVTVREANYNGWNVVSTRTTSSSEFLYLY